MKLSIVIITYNQADYILDAIKSVREQVLDLPFEVIICDDASSDNTISILENYLSNSWPELKHYSIVKNETNLGVTKNYRKAFGLCRGEFIAILEGDDFWPYKYKLKRQVEVLESNSAFSFCASGLISKMEGQNTYYNVPEGNITEDAIKYFNINSIIRHYPIGNFSTCMYRREHVLKLADEWFDVKVYDWFINIFMATFGLLAYLPYPMTVYRKHQKGVWTSMDAIDTNKEIITLADLYDRMLDNKYHSDFESVKRENLKEIRRQKMRKQFSFLKPFLKAIRPR